MFTLPVINKNLKLACSKVYITFQAEKFLLLGSFPVSYNCNLCVGSDRQLVRLVCIPKFSETGVAVVVSLCIFSGMLRIIKGTGLTQKSQHNFQVCLFFMHHTHFIVAWDRNWGGLKFRSCLALQCFSTMINGVFLVVKQKIIWWSMPILLIFKR